MKVIKNVKVVLFDEVVTGAVVFDERIKTIITGEKKDLNRKLDKLNRNSPDLKVMDGKGNYLAPGFIDIHIHGSAGSDTMDGSLQDLQVIKESLLKSGVTSFLATTMSMSVDNIRTALKTIRTQIKKEKENVKESPGACVIGSHLEGPFLNEDYKGAQAAKDIIAPDVNLIEEYKDVIKLVTLAPEVDGAEDLIKYLSQNNIIASAGHTGAGYDDIIKAQKWGLKHATHLFNAMTKLHHRRPGIIGAVLTTDMSCELIADFIHVHPAVIKIVLQAKSLNNIILVTDQMRAGSLNEGTYDLGGQEVTVKNGSARLKNGSLAGSVLVIDQAVRNIKEISDLALHEIINMVSYNPAKLLEMEDEIGRIKEGNRADFVLLNKNLEICEVYKEGKRDNN